jgi:putative radical SAM enzyme (TIGR03279 family)
MQELNLILFPATVIDVSPNSLASRCGLRVGDKLLTINGHPLRDIIDIQIYSSETELSLCYHRDGAERTCTKKRRYGEPLGLDFATALFDDKTRVCQNNCDFCFVTQMAPGLRSSLYVKDDDYRLSFLYGNYVTLTNMREEDWERIAEQFLSPLFVSVHVTNPDARVSLLHNPRASKIVDHLTRLKQMGIEMHTQAVLVPGRNDGAYLEKTILDLVTLYPAVLDLSVVPVGLTRWHHPDCRPYTDVEAKQVLEQLVGWQDKFRKQLGTSFVYPADEWYLKAGVQPPAIEYYDGQLSVLAENGVGTTRRFMDSWQNLQAALQGIGGKSQTWVTGTLFFNVLSQYAGHFTHETSIPVNVLPVTNQMFGDTVTVAGLLTVSDILETMLTSTLGDAVVLPAEMFRGPHKESLDGQTAQELARKIGCPVYLAHYESKGWMVDSVT